MHNNYYFFNKLSPLLEAKLKSAVISECFSQNKDELVIRFETAQEPFFIKASLSPAFSCLSFPENFHRARKNSIDLFDALIGQRVLGVRQFKNERSFSIELSDQFSVLFKMHGNRSNCILFKGEDAEEIFKQTMENDLDLHPSKLDREIDMSFDAFLLHRQNLGAHYFTFGRIVWRYLDTQDFHSQPVEEQWKRIQDVLKKLDSPSDYIIDLGPNFALSLLPLEKVVKEFNDPLNAINRFFVMYTQQDAFVRAKNTVVSTLKSNLHASESYHKKTSERLRSLQHNNNYKLWADLIMANLHAIDIASGEVFLPDFYDENKTVEIKLKKELSPQKNAESFYKKSKKQQVEITMLQQGLAKKEEEIKKLRSQLLEAESAEDVKSLEEFALSAGLPARKEKPSEPLPYHEFEHSGFKILVGKNAQSNDKLTMRHSYKDDMWLHAKDVSGSHVLIKYQAGKSFPKDVIERAAQLAAFYSKRKNENLCPVVVTPRKYVRKRKGDPPGMVVVEKEETILVEPKRS